MKGVGDKRARPGQGSSQVTIMHEARTCSRRYLSRCSPSTRIRWDYSISPIIPLIISINLALRGLDSSGDSDLDRPGRVHGPQARLASSAPETRPGSAGTHLVAIADEVGHNRVLLRWCDPNDPLASTSALRIAILHVFPLPSVNRVGDGEPFAEFALRVLTGPVEALGSMNCDKFPLLSLLLDGFDEECVYAFEHSDGRPMSAGS